MKIKDKLWFIITPMIVIAAGIFEARIAYSSYLEYKELKFIAFSIIFSIITIIAFYVLYKICMYDDYEE